MFNYDTAEAVKDTFHSISNLTRDGKKACNAIATLAETGVVSTVAMLHMNADLASQLRLIKLHAEKGLTALSVPDNSL